MKIWILVDATKLDGKHQTADDVLTEVETFLDGESIDVNESSYELSVEGIGSSMPELNESIALRKAGKQL